jgi:hypothetical protein
MQGRNAAADAPPRTHTIRRRTASLASALALALTACGGAQTLRNLDAAQVAAVKVGDTTADVRAKLGPAENIEKRDRFGREVWTYDYTDPSLPRSYRVVYLYFDPSTGRLTKSESDVNWALYPDAQGR